MNTRLQVEHPVTEAVTGIDIVKEQILIAAGQPLKLKQEDITFKGWAMECRINAEDPFRGFLPSTGVITQSLLPAGPGIRIDTGVYAGYEISPYYDAMISKLIIHEETRKDTITRMKRALEEYRVLGIRTNIPFHQALLENPAFLAGEFDTQFVQDGQMLMQGVKEDKSLPEIAALSAVLATHKHTQQSAVVIQRGKRDTSNWKWVSRWESTKD